MTSINPTIYFHIGQPKTGTSAIQRFMDANRAGLAKYHGILYPNFVSGNVLKQGHINHGHLFDQDIDSFDFDEITNHVIKGVEFCRQNNISKIVISWEGIFRIFDPLKIKQLGEKAKCKVKIILYLRRQDILAESAYKQIGVYTPGVNSVDDFISKHSFDWHILLEKWLGVFPKEDINLRPFEKNFIGEDVVLDFLKTLGVQKENNLNRPSKSNANKNPGFSPEVLEFMKYARDSLTDIHDKRLTDLLVRSLPDKFVKQNPFESYNILSPQKKYELLQKHDDSNRKIARMFFGDTRENLFLDPWPNPDDPWEPRQEITLREVVPILVSTILKLDDRVKAMEKSMIDVNSIKAALIANNLMPESEGSVEYPVSPEELKACLHNFRFIENVKFTDTSFEFVSTGGDPGFIFSYKNLNREITALGLEISPPQPTTFQLFYPDSNNGQYSEPNSVLWEINDGSSKNVFAINPGNQLKQVRIDPGNCKGKFVIHGMWLLLK